MGVGNCQFHHPNYPFEYIIATLDWVGIFWNVLFFVFFLGGGKCLARDLYIPRWHPDREVVVCSGHFLNPWMSASGLMDGMMFWKGIFYFKGWKRALVCSSTVSWSTVAVPAKICWAYLLVHSLLISDCRGSWVEMVPCA